MKAAALFILSLCAAGSAAADPICADRPGKATNPCTVPASQWQVETGLADWTLQKSGGERDTSLVIGESVIKYGLTDRSDVEVEVTPWQRATSSGPGFHDSASGIGDLTVNYKHRLTSGDGPVQVAAIPFVKVPLAKRALGNGEWEGGFKLPVGVAIGGTHLNLALTPELDWAADADGHGHHAAMAQVASLGWAVNDKLSLSGELWHQWDWDPARTTRQASADAATAYLLSNDVQLDAGANFGLNQATPDVEIYAGIAKRF